MHIGESAFGTEYQMKKYKARVNIGSIFVAHVSVFAYSFSLKREIQLT